MFQHDQHPTKFSYRSHPNCCLSPPFPPKLLALYCNEYNPRRQIPSSSFFGRLGMMGVADIFLHLYPTNSQQGIEHTVLLLAILYHKNSVSQRFFISLEINISVVNGNISENNIHCALRKGVSLSDKHSWILHMWYSIHMFLNLNCYHMACLEYQHIKYHYLSHNSQLTIN